MPPPSQTRRPLLAALWAMIALSEFGYFMAGGRHWFQLVGPLCASSLACLYAFRPRAAKTESS